MHGFEFVLLGLVVGIMSGVMGIGGAVFIVPATRQTVAVIPIVPVFPVTENSLSFRGGRC